MSKTEPTGSKTKTKTTKTKNKAGAKSKGDARARPAKNMDKPKPKAGADAKKPEIDAEMKAQLTRDLNRARDSVLARFAQVTLAFMGVPRYAHQSIGDLSKLAMAPLMRERIAIATARPKAEGEAADAGSLSAPLLGIAIWANVSDEVDAKIREQVQAGIFPIKLSGDEWTSGDHIWLLDVIAPTREVAAQVLASFKSVLGAKMPEHKGAQVKLHPVVKSMIGDEILTKMGARGLSNPHTEPGAAAPGVAAANEAAVSSAHPRPDRGTITETKVKMKKPKSPKGKSKPKKRVVN